jgi:hypothetical protein
MNTNQQKTFGNDVEFHLFDVEQKKMVSAIPVLKNDKNSPIDLGDGIKLYADNILVETSFPPYESKNEMLDRFKTVLSRIQTKLGKKYRLVPKAAHEYGAEELQDPKALEIGCTTNYNAWEVCANPSLSFSDGLRTAGFHCHVGHQKLQEFDTRITAIRVMDIVLGAASVIFNENDDEVTRRRLYGQASEHRPTPFGLEYRCLSPATLRSPKLAELVFDLINYSIDLTLNGQGEKLVKSINKDEVIEAINSCNAKLAESILNQINLPKPLMKRIKKKYQSDFYKAWGIKV